MAKNKFEDPQGLEFPNSPEEQLANTAEPSTMDGIIEPRQTLEQELAAAQEAEKEVVAQSPEIELAPQEIQQPKQNIYRSILDQYSQLKQAQQKRDDSVSNLGMLAGANMIAQGGALRGGKDIGAGQSGIDELRQLANAPVKNIEEQMKMGKEAVQVQEDAEMNDVDSDVSKLYRQQAYALLKKLGRDDLDGQLENMSAAQLMKLPGMKNMFQSAGKSNNRYVTIQNPDGTISSKVVNMDTGDVVKDLGLAGYAYGSYKDPVTGEQMRLSKSDPSQGGLRISSGTDAEAKSIPIEKRTVGELRKTGVLTPADFDTVSKDKERFESAMKNQTTIIESLSGIESLVDEAKRNPNTAKALGGIVGSLFEPGKLTDEDAKRYVGDAGIVNEVKNWYSLNAEGKIRPEMADNILHTAKRYREALDKVVRGKASKMAKSAKSSFVGKDTKDMDIEKLTDFYYTPISKNSGDKVKVQLPNGSVGFIPKENLKKAIEKGAKEIK